MKTFNKTILLIVGIFLLTGTVLTITGFILGPTDLVNMPKEKKIDKELNFQKANTALNLDIQAENTSLSIKTGDKFSIKGYGNADFYQDGDTIKLIKKNTGNENNSLRKSILIEHILNNVTQTKHNQLTLTIPKKEWDSVKIDISTGYLTTEYLNSKKVSTSCGAGRIHMDKLIAHDWDSETDTGDTTIDNITVLSSCNLSCEVGNIKLGQKSDNNIINNLKGDCNSGNIKITSNLKGTSIIKTDLGNISLNLLGDPNNYYFKTKSDIGHVSLPSDYDTSKTVSQDSSNIYLSCDLGNIKIKYK